LEKGEAGPKAVVDGGDVLDRPSPDGNGLETGPVRGKSYPAKSVGEPEAEGVWERGRDQVEGDWDWIEFKEEVGAVSPWDVFEPFGLERVMDVNVFDSRKELSDGRGEGVDAKMRREGEVKGLNGVESESGEEFGEGWNSRDWGEGKSSNWTVL
jgi:hypothetical protein